MNFDMNRTWSQAIALVGGNLQLLAIIAGVFLLLPSALFYVALPDVMNTLTTAQDPEMVTALLKQNAAPMIGFGLLAVLAQLIGYLAMIALMGDGRPTVGEALRRALSLLPTAIGVTLLLVLVYMAVGAILAVLLGVMIAAVTMVAGEGAAVALGFLGAVVLLLAIVWVMTRFVLTTPAIVLDRLTSPVAAMRRSWQLTRRHGGRIFGFFMLLLVAYLVISLLLGSLFGLIAAAFGGGGASALVLGLANGLIGAGVAMVLSGIMVSMHGQLAGVSGPQAEDIFG